MIAAHISTAATITLAVLVFFLVLALLTFARVLLRRAPPTYKRFRVGVFVERDDHRAGPPPHDDDELPRPPRA